MAADTEGVTILGYRGTIPRIEALVSALPDGARVQFVRADRVYGSGHLEAAVRMATRAMARGRAKADTLPVETLRYAAGARQIGKAFHLLGLITSDAETEIVTIAWGEDGVAGAARVAEQFNWVRDDSVIREREAALDALGVTRTERAMLPESSWAALVLERVALADFAK